MFTAVDLEVIGVAALPLVIATARLLQQRRRRIIRKSRAWANDERRPASAAPVDVGVRPPVVSGQLQRVRRP